MPAIEAQAGVPAWVTIAIAGAGIVGTVVAPIVSSWLAGKRERRRDEQEARRLETAHQQAREIQADAWKREDEKARSERAHAEEMGSSAEKVAYHQKQVALCVTLEEQVQELLAVRVAPTCSFDGPAWVERLKQYSGRVSLDGKSRELRFAYLGLLVEVMGAGKDIVARAHLLSRALKRALRDLGYPGAANWSEDQLKPLTPKELAYPWPEDAED